ncbi:F0F1 ATP synthase subunit delta [Candidatus Palibaumannia cicadellinicola]|uniref:ATP synthase subunit delta n=1 Tax=Candidatus Palibaumannia cicadellinicola TaxID=186490 RepID=A0A088MXF6_9GAMM|nr:F0F1 ATP synthase subunit delta [Candidatus Baumannia cicadellinicola]AIN47050.1 ATP synthase delta chain [Candidatus Baumannia cicadellinicola]
MSEFITIAHPYAKAAFDFAVEHKKIESWQSMLLFSAEVSNNKDIKKLLANKVILDVQLAKIFISVCGDQLNIYGQNLIKIMAQNKRLIVLPYVFQNFINLRTQYELAVEVELISIHRLNQAQITKITTALEQRISRKITLNCKIDRSVMAGIIIRINDMVIDGSIRGRLERLTRSLSI